MLLLTRLDGRGLHRGCERVWFWALSKWSSVSGVRRTWGVLLHLSSFLQWPLLQPASWPLWPHPQSLPEQLHLPDTLWWNSLLQMPSWWVKTHLHKLPLIVLFYSLALTRFLISFSACLLSECKYTVLPRGSVQVDDKWSSKLKTKNKFVKQVHELCALWINSQVKAEKQGWILSLLNMHVCLPCSLGTVIIDIIH